MTTKEKLEQLGWEIENKSNLITLVRNDSIVNYYTKIKTLNYVNCTYLEIYSLELILDYIKEQENDK